MDKRQSIKIKNDLYYEHYEIGINKDNIKHQKILSEFDILRDQYFDEAMKKFNNGESIEEIEKFIDNSPVKNIKWWIMKKIKRIKYE